MWNELSRWLTDPSGLTPHGFCLSWEPALIWTYALSDIGIGVAYFTIPLALAVFVRRRLDLVFRPIFWLFAAFILLCGMTHWLDVLTLWVPAYGLEASVKVMTGIVSLITAVALWWRMPDALALPSPAQLRAANEALRESQDRLHHAQKMEAVGQLTGGVAHDFNNMLQVFESGLNLMQRRIAQGRVSELDRYFASMRQALDRSVSLTHRLLAFSRRQSLQLHAIDANALVHGLEELLRRTLGPAIRPRLMLDDSVRAVVSDSNQLETALLNLAINARDAMPGGGMLTIATRNRILDTRDLMPDDGAEPGEYVEITVTDTGAGMASEVLARVFEPFFTTKPSGQGTGLGLSQVYGFIRQCGGFVRIESVVGSGTSVRLFLVQARRDADAPQRENVTADAVGESVDGTVLLVDDETAIRVQIAEALRESGLTVLQAEDAASGLRHLRELAAMDLLVTDVALPGQNGRQLAEAARISRPRLPVLFITGHAGTVFDDMPLSPGMEVLHKPIAMDKLTGKVVAMLREARDLKPG
jgi:signal transduction histidine kinase/ActR/RegA family two-component response regulator